MATLGNNYLIVFAREPALGEVKQRLAADLGAQGALRVYQRLLDRSLRLAQSIGRHGLFSSGAGQAVRVRIASAGLDAHYQHSSRHQARLDEYCQRTGALRLPQRGDDLGQRMWHSIQDVSQHPEDRIVLIGSDCPGLQRMDLRMAFESLEHADIAMTPTQDGGYCLIGMHGTVPAVFEGISWGQDTVAQQTRRRCADLGLSVAELRTLADIDFVDDWKQWCHHQSGRELSEYPWELACR
jgi:rSAM/selenodomain-associated transferase 1